MIFKDKTSPPHELKNIFYIIPNFTSSGIFVIADSAVLQNENSFSPEIKQILLFIRQSPNTYFYNLTTSEKNKNLQTVESLWEFLYSNKASRQSLLIAIGGGITSDLTSFVASTFNRGINLIIIPTTLLAMVDASIGGKNGFHLHNLKNYIGTFYSPTDILLNTGFLNTLPTTQLLSGFGEMFKTALLHSKSLFLKTRQCLINTLNTPPSDDISQHFNPILPQIINTKKKFIRKDPLDKNIRHALNLGHTIAHALESIQLQYNHTPYLHGYAVMYGLIGELYLSHRLLGCDKKILLTLTDITKKYYGKPNQNCQHIPDILSLIEKDKKVTPAQTKNSTITGFTLLETINTPAINTPVPTQNIEEALEFLFSL